MLSQKESEIFLKFAESNGYEGFHGTKFKIRGTITSSGETVLKHLNFPQGVNAEKDPELGLLAFKCLTNSGLKSSLIEVLRTKNFAEKVSVLGDVDQEVVGQLVGPNKGVIAELARRVSFFIHVDGKEKREEDNIMAIDTETRNIISHLRLDALIRERGLTKKMILEQSELYAATEFNPFTTDFVIEVERDFLKLKAFNTYNPPPWRRLANPPKSALRGFIKKVFEHVIPKESEREFVLDWCSHALKKRNQTVLCLAGNKGTGKNLFVEKILGAVIGYQYTESVGQAFLNEKFNGSLYGKRLVILDEVTTNSQVAIDAIKRNANDRINIEFKGKDSFTAANTASIALLSNNITKLGIESNDRRYSIPEVAKKPLNQVVNPEEISVFNAALERGEEWVMREIAEFGYFLLERQAKYDPTVPLKGDYFYYIAQFSLPPWAPYLFEYLAEYGKADELILFRDAIKIPSQDKKNNPYLRVPTRMKDFESSLADFRYKGKIPIGILDYGKHNGHQCPGLIPDAEFLEALRQDPFYAKSIVEGQEEAAPEAVEMADDFDETELEAENYL